MEADINFSNANKRRGIRQFNNSSMSTSGCRYRTSENRENRENEREDREEVEGGRGGELVQSQSLSHLHPQQPLSDSPYAPALRELLETLDRKTLDALASTATANRLLPVHRNEAIDLILMYTVNMARLFSYRRMTSQVLLQYLNKRGVEARGGASKPELIDLVRIELEKSIKQTKSTSNTNNPKKSLKFDDSDDSTTLPSPSPPPPPDHHDHDTTAPTTTITIHHHHHHHHHDNNAMSTPPPSPAKSSGTIAVASIGDGNLDMNFDSGSVNMTLSVHSSGGGGGGTMGVFGGSGDISSNSIISNSIGGDYSVGIAGGGGVGNPSEVFAREFCGWFYTMLNRLQPEASHLAGDSLSEETFVANANLELYLYYGQQVEEKRVKGRHDAYTTLRDTLIASSVSFAPNMETGVRCEVTEHGLAKVWCCGTLHRRDAAVGVFEQEFGLVRCPQGSWKVAVFKSNFKHVQYLASVCGSSS